MPYPYKVVMAACCLALLVGCVQRPAAPPPRPEPGPPVVLQPGQPQAPGRIGPASPDWVVRGSGAYQEGSERYFYGVGMATAASGNRILIRTAADNLARRELGQVLRNYLTELAGGGAKDDDGSREELIQDNLRKGVVAEHWTDTRDGRMYALCRLDLKQFKQALAGSRAFETAQRGALLEMADRQHARMAGAR